MLNKTLQSLSFDRPNLLKWIVEVTNYVNKAFEYSTQKAQQYIRRRKPVILLCESEHFILPFKRKRVATMTWEKILYSPLLVSKGNQRSPHLTLLSAPNRLLVLITVQPLLWLDETHFLSWGFGTAPESNIFLIQYFLLICQSLTHCKTYSWTTTNEFWFWT